MKMIQIIIEKIIFVKICNIIVSLKKVTKFLFIPCLILNKDDFQSTLRISAP